MKKYMELHYNRGRAFKYCKNCVNGFRKSLFLRITPFGKVNKWLCGANSFYEPRQHNFTTQCNLYERIWWKFWVRPAKSNDEWDKEREKG